MNLIEAIDKMNEGKIIKRKGQNCIYFIKNTRIIQKYKTSEYMVRTVSIEDIVSKEWEVI